MAKKVVARNKQTNSSEDLRKNLDQPVQNSQGLSRGGDKVRNNLSERKGNASMAPIKKLIDQEIQNKQHPKKNASSSPGVIARLMGVDMLPSEMKPVEKKNEANANTLINEKLAKNDSKRNAKSPRQRRSVSFDSIEDNVVDQWSYDTFGYDKPRRREHPQEEELQKFKEEFEARLTQRAKKCSMENLDIEKKVLYGNSTKMAENVKLLEPKGGSKEINCHERVGLQSKRFKNTYSSSQKNENVEIKPSFLQDSDRLAVVDVVPSKIVILRPGPDSIGTYEECLNSARTSRESTSMEDFLEEVKSRFKCEMMEKTCNESLCNENPSDPKQIAQRIAKHVKESVTRDLGMNLFRSESTRSYRSDLHVDETDASDFISRDTRRFLVDRFKNVLKEEETDRHEPVVHESKRSSMQSHQRNRMRKSQDVSESKNKSRLNKLENGSHTQNKGEIQEESSSSSPRNLIRSLSAPVSGTSFGKLLLEDRHLLTGAHIRRKHEEPKRANTNLNEKKKEKFNLKEKVTSFKQSITHKGKLFGKKSQSSNEEHGNGHEITEDSPKRSSMTSFYDQHEDYTEVPPSPASTCSYVHEVSIQPTEHFSSTSMSDVASADDNSKAKVFMEISSNLNELHRQLNESDTDISEEAMVDEQPIDNLPEIEDRDESYIRDLLIVSGLYDGSFHQTSSIWEPISIQVFEEVEESFKHKTNNDQGEKLNHRMLFDFLNQTLPNLLEPAMSISKYKNATSPKPLLGKKLLDQVWKIIRAYVHPATELAQLSFDSLLARDLKSSTWYALMDDDVNAIGKDIESQITSDLIDEMVKGMMSRRRRRTKHKRHQWRI